MELQENLDFLYSYVSYPRIEGLEELNTKIKETVIKNQNKFKIIAKQEKTEKSMPYEFIIDSNVHFNGSVVSVKLTNYVYTGGGAGDSILYTFNYDTAENRFLDISDVIHFSLEELSQICESSLTYSLISRKEEIEEEISDIISFDIKEATFPLEENFNNFLIINGYLYIFFENLQSSLYNKGIPYVVVDLS